MRLTPATITMQIVIVSVLFFVIALGILGDYEDELAEEARYAEFVCSGAWGNYKGIELDCE
jgi:hypothetical protein